VQEYDFNLAGVGDWMIYQSRYNTIFVPVLGRYVLALRIGKVLGKLKFWMVW